MARHHWMGSCNIWGLCSEVTEHRTEHEFELVTTPNALSPSYTRSDINWGSQSRFSPRLSGALDSLYFINNDTHSYLVANTHEVLDRDSTSLTRRYTIYIYQLNGDGTPQSPDILFNDTRPYRVSCSEGSYGSGGAPIQAVPSPSGSHIILVDNHQACNETTTVHLELFDATTLESVSERWLAHQEPPTDWGTNNSPAYWVSIASSQQATAATAISNKTQLIADVTSLSRADTRWPRVHQDWLDQKNLEASEETLEYLIFKESDAYRIDEAGELETTSLSEPESQFFIERDSPGQLGYRYVFDAATGHYHIDELNSYDSALNARLAWWSTLYYSSPDRFSSSNELSAIGSSYDKFILYWDNNGPDDVKEAAFEVTENDYANGTLVGRLHGMETSTAGMWSSAPITVGQEDIVPSANWHWARMTMVRDSNGALRSCWLYESSESAVRNASIDVQNLESGCLGAAWPMLSPPSNDSPF